MGLYTASSTISSDAVKLCVFDLRRGQREGEEVEKILFFYPPHLPLTEQLSVIGLSEGLITFTRIFSPDAACEVIEAERHSHVFYEAEPDIWMVMVVEKNKELEAIWRIEALRSMLKEVHDLFVMFNGSVRAMLDKESSGALVRPHLYSFVTDYLFASQKRYPLDFCCWGNAEVPLSFFIGFLPLWHTAEVASLVPHVKIFCLRQISFPERNSSYHAFAIRYKNEEPFKC